MSFGNTIYIKEEERCGEESGVISYNRPQRSQCFSQTTFHEGRVEINKRPPSSGKNCLPVKGFAQEKWAVQPCKKSYRLNGVGTEEQLVRESSDSRNSKGDNNPKDTVFPGPFQGDSLQHFTETPLYIEKSLSLADLRRFAILEELKTPPICNNSSGFKTAPKKSYRSGRVIMTETKRRSMGDGWLGMRPSPMTHSLRTDLALIRNRNCLDPKRFYKSNDVQIGERMVQVGNVIEGASEFYSSRLIKRQRRSNLTEEVLADGSSLYVQTKYRNLQKAKTVKATSRKNAKKT